MNDYAQQILVHEHMSERLHHAENERLARRARVHRDGSVSFIRMVASAIRAGASQVAGGASRAGVNRNRLASA